MGNKHIHDTKVTERCKDINGCPVLKGIQWGFSVFLFSDIIMNLRWIMLLVLNLTGTQILCDRTDIIRVSLICEPESLTMTNFYRISYTYVVRSCIDYVMYNHQISLISLICFQTISAIIKIMTYYGWFNDIHILGVIFGSSIYITYYYII
jgi:hypothetical protein